MLRWMWRCLLHFKDEDHDLFMPDRAGQNHPLERLCPNLQIAILGEQPSIFEYFSLIPE